ncbi:hypothetical protein Scep_029401 [Stephania cephalantha]|uniref:Uncharacterized protein n=1 Tax=Stephania cephalantha TaxID=152367 RepID=A0AAP0DXL0_9MAGN
MGEAVSRNRVRGPVKCTDRDIGLVMHKDKDMDLDRDFNVLFGSVDSHVTSPVGVHSRGQAQQSQEQVHAITPSVPTTIHRTLIEGISWVETHSNRETDGQSEKFIYILADIRGYEYVSDGGSWDSCSEISEEPSLSRRSPALQSKMGVWPWASMALGSKSWIRDPQRVDSNTFENLAVKMLESINATSVAQEERTTIAIRPRVEPVVAVSSSD